MTTDRKPSLIEQIEADPREKALLDAARRELAMRNPNNELCVGCGEVAKGYAFVGNERYCHGDYDKTTTCFMVASHSYELAIRNGVRRSALITREDLE